MSNTTMKPGPLTNPKRATPWYQLVALADSMYADDATALAVDDYYVVDDEASDVFELAESVLRAAPQSLTEPSDEDSELFEAQIEKLSAICIKHAPEGYTFGERRGALGFWTAEEMDNN